MNTDQIKNQLRKIDSKVNESANAGYILTDIITAFIRKELRNRKIVCFYNEDASQNEAVLLDAVKITYDVSEDGKTCGYRYESI